MQGLSYPSPRQSKQAQYFTEVSLPNQTISDVSSASDLSLVSDWFTQIVINDIRFRHLFPQIIASYLDEMPASSHIGFYGCGRSALDMVETFPESVKRHNAVFFTTYKDESADFHGFPKKTVEDIVSNPPDLIFIMSHAHEKTMLSQLETLDRKTVLTLEEVITQCIRTEHLDEVVQWMDKEIDGLAGKLNAMFQNGDKVMGYVAISFGHHIPAYLKALRQKGYKIVVFTTDDVHAPIPLDEMLTQGYIDFFHTTFSSGMLQYEITRLVKRFTFSHIHFFLIHTNAGFIESVMSQHACPVTVEYDDFMTVLFEDQTYFETFSRLSRTSKDKILDQQKYIYTHAAGIVYKDAPETFDFLEKKYNHRPPALFQLPVIDRQFVNASKSVKKLSEEDGRIHIVFPHGLHLNPMLETFFDHRTLFNTIEILNAQGIHFSIYNSLDITGEGYEDYIRLAEGNELFDYHFCIPFYEFLPVLSRYDFGWASYDFIHGDRFDYYIKTTMGKKIFCYVNAGIPTLVSPELAHMCRYVRDHDIGICVGTGDWPDLKKNLSSLDMSRFQKGIDAVRNDLSIDRQAERLASFYDRVTGS